MSYGHSSPEDFWYDQDHDEWVLLLKGEARLRFENKNQLKLLQEGHFVHIPGHIRHRVEWTKENTPTIWLAIHMPSQ